MTVNMVKYILESARPRQWTKNCFVFAALLFSKNLFNVPLLFRAVFAFIIFCLLSGCVYLLNDIVDLTGDKIHPVKSRRPLASGRLGISEAMWVLVILTPLSLGASLYLNVSFFLVALTYVLAQLAYSFFLKHIVILDVFAVTLGFVLRVAAGALAIDVESSSWFLICATLLALFLALSKRRHELVTLELNAPSHRKVLSEYSPDLLDQMMSVVTASTVIAYSLYTMSEETITRVGTRNLIYTVPFVLYGIFRYLYLIHKKGEGGNPEMVLITDKPLMIDILLWVITVAIVLYA
jgi:4-hydroxybenzoate polyprenyltransferase